MKQVLLTAMLVSLLGVLVGGWVVGLSVRDTGEPGVDSSPFLSAVKGGIAGGLIGLALGLGGSALIRRTPRPPPRG